MKPLEYGLLTAGTLFAITNPLAVVPAFLAMTESDSGPARLRMALNASVTCAAVLIAFAVLGNAIFKAMGITLPSFQIAGGIVLLLVSLDSLRARRSAVQETQEETRQGVAKNDVSITPLAIPMIAGPGAITTVIVLEAKARSLLQQASLYTAIVLVSLSCYVILRLAVTQARRISPIALSVSTRLMGLFLAATGVEFILSALRTELLRA